MQIRLVVLPIVAAAGVSCSSMGSDEIGNWGGQGVSAAIGARSTRFYFGCSAATLARIQISGAGQFVLTGADTVYIGPARDTLPSAPTTLPIRVVGTVMGDQLSIDVSFSADPSASATHYDLIRDNAPDFSHTGCRD